jgi:renalase
LIHDPVDPQRSGSTSRWVLSAAGPERVKRSPVAVIGAGIAGLSCAAALHDSGLAVRVFEKSHGAAGRMSTRRGDGWQCDHGAQYFTARHPDFRAAVGRWLQAGVVAPWTPRLRVLGGAAGHSTDPTVERFVGLPGMAAPGRRMAETLNLTTQTTVVQLRRQADGWQLCCAEQGWLDQRFDAVVLAVPAPQAVPLLAPASPQLAALAASAAMRGCWALMLRFAARVELPFDAAFVNDGPLRWIARDSSKPARSGPDTWCLHASAPWSEAHIERDKDTVTARLVAAFRALGGPAPNALTAHRWRYADTEPALDAGCAWHDGDALGLCGDWLNGGKVEGAWRSGKLLAERVAHTLCQGASPRSTA